MFREDVFERKTSSESSEKKFREDVFERQTFRKFKKMKNFRKKVQTMQKKLKVLEDFFGFNKIKIE